MKNDFRARSHPAYWAFIVHRVSGLLLAVFLPFHFWVLGQALRNTEVLEGYAEAQLDALNSVIDRLPATTSNEYETYILSVIGQCVRAEMLAAISGESA